MILNYVPWNFSNHELDRNLNRLEAKVALLELEKTRLSEDTARQAQAIQDLTDQKKSLDSELQEKKNLVIFKALHTLKDLPLG